MSSFDYAKLTSDNQRPQQEVNMTDIVVHPQNHQYNPAQQPYQQQLPGPRWGWGNLILSMCSMCCCQMFGFIATIISILSYVDHKSKDFARSKNKGSHARNLAICAIISGTVIIVMTFASVYALVWNAKKGLEAFNNDLQLDSATPSPIPYDSFDNQY